MKILLVSQTYKDSFPPRGLSMGSAVKQAENLSKNHQVLVLTCGRVIHAEKINDNLLIKSFTGWLIPDPVNYVISFPLLNRFIYEAKEFNPDVVMVSKFMFFNSLVIPLAKIMGFKVVTTTDTFPGINWFPRSRLIGAVMWIYARAIGLPLLWLSDKVILLYPGLADIAKKFKLNYVVIPNGVEGKLLGKLSKPSDIIKKRGEFWVGYVGRSESVKGYDLALKIADKMSNILKIKFVFVGGNQKQVNEGNKIFLGFRHDIYNIYQLFDVLILPSYSEGLPNAVMEAMAQKVVCVASKVGGVSYLIKHKITGFLVKPGDEKNFIRFIKTLKFNPDLRKRMGWLARIKIKSDHNWLKIVKKYEKALVSI